MKAVLVWPVIPLPNNARPGIARLIDEAATDVPAVAERLGLRPLSEPSKWAVVPGEAMPGMETHAEVLRCEIEAERVPMKERETGYQWRANAVVSGR